MRATSASNKNPTTALVVGCSALLGALLVVLFQQISSFSVTNNERVLSAALDVPLAPLTPEHQRHLHFTLQEQDDWIESTFRAADPGEQAWCKRVLKTGTSWQHPSKKGAQFGQDVFVARNLFLDHAMRSNQNGNNSKSSMFYVESGANHFSTISGSYFFDKCLGWSGLCIEPNPQYHEDLAEKRSCTLVPKCLSSSSEEMMLGGLPKHRAGGFFIKDIPADKNGTKTVPDGWTRVQCDPLHKILEETNSPTHIDLFVLDVEGAEFVVLEAIHWEKVTFGALQVEDNGFPAFWSKRLDYNMAMRGYSKLFGMAIDSLYVKRGTGLGDWEEFWYPPDWKSFEGNINNIAKGYQKTHRVAKPQH